MKLLLPSLLVSFAFAQCLAQVRDEPAVGVVRTPPRTGPGAHYVANREPLMPNPLIKLPIGTIVPKGWLLGQLDRKNKSPGLQNRGCMLAYSPHLYRCCQHNVAMGWPYYAEHLWMATQDRGLAAMLYAAGEVEAKVGEGATVKIVETTDYPFDETVTLAIATSESVEFPLYLRVPRWCEGAKVRLNKQAVPAVARPLSYIRIDRAWKDGDTVTLELPMEIATTVWRSNADSISVARGPLSYSLKIGERWVKWGTSEKWPGYEVFASTPWNYGLIVNRAEPASSFEVVKKSGAIAKQPFTPQAAPIEIKAKGKRIPQWQMDRLGLVGRLQASPVKSDEPTESITLIPMGCARLRISAFPQIGEGPSAFEWQPPPPVVHEASHCHSGDSVDAVSDGQVPKNSNDQSIPRFTWWDHKGTKEWVTWRFEKPRQVSWCEVYWFDDTPVGQCRVPASWRLLYRDGERWKPVRKASPFGTRADGFNKVTFEPVTTKELKIEVQLKPERSGGILEWRVGR